MLLNFLQIILDENGVQDWLNNDDIIAKAVFDNAQNRSGWMYFEVVTKESATDDQQVININILFAKIPIGRALSLPSSYIQLHR